MKGQPWPGWTVYGPMGEPGGDEVHVNFIKSECEEMLSKQLERMYNSIGNTPQETWEVSGELQI